MRSSLPLEAVKLKLIILENFCCFFTSNKQSYFFLVKLYMFFAKKYVLYLWTLPRTCHALGYLQFVFTERTLIPWASTHINLQGKRWRRRILSGTYFQLVHTTFKFKLDKVNCIDNFKHDWMRKRLRVSNSLYIVAFYFSTLVWNSRYGNLLSIGDL